MVKSFSRNNSMKIAPLLICAFLVGTGFAQQSGVPGDGIPDIYYALGGPFTFNTSLGPVTLNPGEMTVDTDGRDMVALLVGSSVEVTSMMTNGTSVGCGLCDNGFLPDPNAPPFNVSSWTAGYIAGSNQWIRTSPLSTAGFQGVIGQYDDPNDLFPDSLANFGEGVFFDDIFTDDNGGQWEVTFATLDSGTFLTNVTFGFQYNNDPPVAEDDEYSVLIGGVLDTAAGGLPGLLDNDFDPEGNPITALGPGDYLGGVSPAFGTVSVAADGSFVYTHDGSSTMTDTFSYFAIDDYAQFDEAFVTINVVPEPHSYLVICSAILLRLTRRKYRTRCHEFAQECH